MRRHTRTTLLLSAGLLLASGPAALADPPARTNLFLCGPGSLAERTQAGNSPVFKSGPADLSAGDTYGTQQDCDNEENSNGTYAWTLDHASSNVSPGNGRQHGTEHGSWTVALDDGTQTAGIYNGRIFEDTCATATSNGQCFRSGGNINSARDDGSDDNSTEGAPVAHWVGKYATTVTATDCGDDDGCQYEQQTILTYRQVGPRS